VALPLPKLPTDNLYKFVALTGLTLIALAVYLTGRTAESMSEKLAPIARSTAVAKHKYEQLDKVFSAARQESEELRKATAALRAEFNAIVDDRDLTLAQKKARAVGIQERNDKLEERSLRLQGEMKPHEAEVDAASDLLAEAGADLEGVRPFRDETIWIERICWALYLLGVACAAWGFTFWYLKVQKFQDKALAEGHVDGKVE
jgi:hypothetical protein